MGLVLILTGKISTYSKISTHWKISAYDRPLLENKCRRLFSSKYNNINAFMKAHGNCNTFLDIFKLWIDNHMTNQYTFIHLHIYNWIVRHSLLDWFQDDPGKTVQDGSEYHGFVYICTLHMLSCFSRTGWTKWAGRIWRWNNQVRLFMLKYLQSVQVHETLLCNYIFINAVEVHEHASKWIHSLKVILE